ALRDKSGLVAVQASAALAELGESDGIDRLIEYAYGELNARMLALQGLAHKPDERARETLTYILRNEEEYVEARLAAARGLGGLNSNAGFELAERHLAHTNKDANEQARVRVLAATALGAIGDERALPALRDAAESSGDERVQVAASYAILQILKKSESSGSASRRAGK
ncbi:MAG: HEAT repeat domain-containing protein, partial [Phycisphaerales bacterium]|nr:HEAT repeat domain-containing protein [Phycisphaerales bacterium]